MEVETEMREALALLHATEHPNFAAVFQQLALLKRYRDLVDFLNKWSGKYFEKCKGGLKDVVESFQARIAADKTNRSLHDMHDFIKSLDGIHDDKVFDAAIEVLFRYPLDQTYLEFVPSKRIDVFLEKQTPMKTKSLTLETPVNAASMSKDAVKASLILARRCHRAQEHLRSGLILVQVACRQGTNDDKIPFDTRLELLQEDAQNQFLHVGSSSALKCVSRHVDHIKFQQVLTLAIGASEDAVCQRLTHEILTDRQLFETVTTHPTLKVDVTWQERLLELIEAYK